MNTGLIFIFLASAALAASTISIRRGVSRTGEAYTPVLISVSIGALLFTLMMVFTAEWPKVWSLSWQGLALLGGAGIIHFVGGRFLYYNSVRLIGGNKAGAIVKAEILYAVASGIILLNEPLTVSLIHGVLWIALGVTMVSLERQNPGAGEPVGAARIQARGVLTALGAGLLWGISAVMVKPVITEMGSPFVGVFVSYMAAFLVAAGLLLGKRQREQLLNLRRFSLRTFVIAGAFTSIAQLSRYIALSYNPVSIVQPLIPGTNVLFILLFSFLLNRSIEVFSRKIIIGIAATAVGTGLLIFS